MPIELNMFDASRVKYRKNMKVINLTYTEVFNIKTGAYIMPANTLRFLDDQIESFKNTFKEIKQYNDDLVYTKVLVGCANIYIDIRFKAWYRFYKVEENEKIIWKVRKHTDDLGKYLYRNCNDLIIPEYNFDSFTEILDWLKKTFEK